jgi:mono/diheme cytochrome c family protein
MRAVTPLAAALLALPFVAVPGAASAQPAPNGAQEFRMSCAVCHGEDARGDGPLAKLLKVNPSNLTLLARQNHGTFPAEHISEMIDGRAQVNGHGTREMPVWGARYETEVARDYGPFGSESMVKARIAELVKYLQSIQKK